MNKRLLLSVLCLLSCAANASLYGGLNLGVNLVNTKKKLLYPLESVTPAFATYRSGYMGFHGQLLAGYDVHFTDRMTAAIEGDIDFFTGRAQYRINNWFLSEGVGAKEKLENGFAIFLLPGYQYNPNLRFFIGPGVSYNRFATKTNNTAGNVGVTGNFHKWLAGGGVKIGAAVSFTENTELSITYQYTQYQNATWSNVEPVSNESVKGHYMPNANLVLVGLTLRIPEAKVYTK